MQLYLIASALLLAGATANPVRRDECSEIADFEEKADKFFIHFVQHYSHKCFELDTCMVPKALSHEEAPLEGTVCYEVYRAKVEEKRDEYYDWCFALGPLPSFLSDDFERAEIDPTVPGACENSKDFELS